MEYSKLVAVTGLPGLFELINSKTDGAIVKSLDDSTTRFVSSRIHNFSHLESIEVYTVRDNVNLVDVLNAMDKNGGSLPDDKDGGAVKKYFETVYPDMDFDRVYASDMKKMVKWFAVLKKNNVTIKLSEVPEEEEATEVTEAPVEVATIAEAKPAAKKAPAKKKAVAEEATPATEVAATDAAPKKKPAAKKAAAKKKAE